MANTSTKNAQAKSRYTPALWLIDLTNDIRICETDIKNILAGKPLTLALQLRAYDLLDEIAGYQPLNEQIKLLVAQLDSNSKDEIIHNFSNAVESFTALTDSNSAKLENAFMESDLKSAAASYLRPWAAQYEKLQERTNKAIALYNAADYAHKCQLTGNWIEKWQSLRKVRKMAGFRLERKRTGNYVTKTYELMLDAQKELMAAQQQMHSHNVGYKCGQMLYGKIAALLHDCKFCREDYNEIPAVK